MLVAYYSSIIKQIVESTFSEHLFDDASCILDGFFIINVKFDDVQAGVALLLQQLKSRCSVRVATSGEDRVRRHR